MTTERPCGRCDPCQWGGVCRRFVPVVRDALAGDERDPRHGRLWRNLGGGRYEEVIQLDERHKEPQQHDAAQREGHHDEEQEHEDQEHEDQEEDQERQGPRRPGELDRTDLKRLAVSLLKRLSDGGER